MTADSRRLQDPDSRGYLHRDLQRRVLIGLLAIAVVLAIIIVPLMVNSEYRLDVARAVGLVPDREGELVASGDSGASLIVLPSEHDVEESDLVQLRFLAAFIAWPEDGQLRLESLNGDDELTVPLESYELVSASPDATMMYMQGPSQAALIDVDAAEVVNVLPADEAPDVQWDWQTAVWQRQTFLCDRVSNTATWIGCFPRPTLDRYIIGDWHLDLVRYGAPDEVHEVVRGLGFQPIIGFTADDEWLYTNNELGIRRFDVSEVTGT